MKRGHGNGRHRKKVSSPLQRLAVWWDTGRTAPNVSSQPPCCVCARCRGPVRDRSKELATSPGSGGAPLFWKRRFSHGRPFSRRFPRFSIPAPLNPHRCFPSPTNDLFGPRLYLHLLLRPPDRPCLAITLGQTSAPCTRSSRTKRRNLPSQSIITTRPATATTRSRSPVRCFLQTDSSTGSSSSQRTRRPLTPSSTPHPNHPGRRRPPSPPARPSPSAALPRLRLQSRQ